MRGEQSFETRRPRAAQEPFVLARTEDGVRVYSAADPARTYLVGGSPQAPTCTCTDFEVRGECAHIEAALAGIGVAPPRGFPAPVDEELEERLAIQEEGKPRERSKRTPASKGNGAAAMLLKRSVSPDGRIDALSVEFSAPLDGLTAGEIKTKAVETLKLQAEIVQGFLGAQKPAVPTAVTGRTNGSGNGNARPVLPEPDGAVEARLVGIAGMDGKWGRRLYLNVQVDGRTIRLFGNKQQLADAITAAGHRCETKEIAEGVSLDIPCRVTTKPSDDGRYTNIDQVFPPRSRGNGNGAWR